MATHSSAAVAGTSNDDRLTRRIERIRARDARSDDNDRIAMDWRETSLYYLVNTHVHVLLVNIILLYRTRYFTKSIEIPLT